MGFSFSSSLIRFFCLEKKPYLVNDVFLVTLTVLLYCLFMLTNSKISCSWDAPSVSYLSAGLEHKTQHFENTVTNDIDKIGR